MMKTNPWMRVVFALAQFSLLVAIIAYAALAQSQQPRIPKPSDTDVTARTMKPIRGVYTYGSYRLSYAARMKDPSQAIVRIQSAELTLDATADLGPNRRPQRVVLNGYGRKLSPELKKALAEFSNELERDLNPDDRELAPQEDLLLRCAMYWAEAPVGEKIGRQELRR